MPELPEVETIRADLAGRVTGRRITGVQLLWPGCVATPSPDEFAAKLPGHTFLEAGRRGKFVVFSLDGGAFLTVHLRMTGRLRWIPALPRGTSGGGEDGSTREPSRHLRAVLALDSGDALHFEDQRKFGRLYLTPDKAELATVLRKLGPEPLDATFTLNALMEQLSKRRMRLKALLLDQRFLAGLGNIYVDEALFRARLNPLRGSDTLTLEEIARLHQGIVDALRQGIANRGTTLSDYRDAWGTAGLNRERLLVFRREGKPCFTCGAFIQKERIAGRGTHYCSICQPAPAGS